MKIVLSIIVSLYAALSFALKAAEARVNVRSFGEARWQEKDMNRNGKLDIVELIAWERSLSFSTVQRFDRNKDGRWDNAERKAALFALVLPLAEPLEARFDKNRDGKLDAEERKAMAEEPQEKRRRFIEEFDKNKDGKVDKTEQDAAYAHWHRQFREKQLAIFGEALAQLERDSAHVGQGVGQK